MPKLKTKKTLSKRVKISKTGKVLKKQNRTGHLKVKWKAKKRYNKSGLEQVPNKGFVDKIKSLLPKSK